MELNVFCFYIESVNFMTFEHFYFKSHIQMEVELKNGRKIVEKQVNLVL